MQGGFCHGRDTTGRLGRHIDHRFLRRSVRRHGGAAPFRLFHPRAFLGEDEEHVRAGLRFHDARRVAARLAPVWLPVGF